MNTILKVFKFTFLQEVKKKSFIISTAIITLAILGITIGPKIYNKVKAKDENTGGQQEKDRQIYLIDEKNVLPKAATALEQHFQDSNVITIEIRALEEKKKEISNSSNDIILSIKEGNPPSINLYRKNFQSGPSINNIQQVLSGVWADDQLIKRNISTEDIALSKTLLDINLTDTDNLNPASYALSLVFCFFLFFAIYGSSISVANSIAMEKSSRVMETLVVSTKPKYILLGKAMATGSVGLLQILWFALVAYASYNLFFPEDFSIGGTAIDLSGISIVSLLLIVLIFLLGYALYVFLAAACGASVDKIEDVNQAMMPIIVLSLGSFYLSYFSISFMVTTGPFAKAATYLPFASPLYLPFLVLNNIGDKKTILVSLAILSLTVLLIAYASIKIYTAGVMNYGKKKKFTELFQIGKTL